MKIDHVAIWVLDLEKTKLFYEKYFNASCSNLYHNKTRNFKSYFLSFDDGCRIELMNKPELEVLPKSSDMQGPGFIHLAVSAGSREKVDSLTDILRNDGYRIIGEPRITGDGYYESVVLDPENNIVEIVA